MNTTIKHLSKLNEKGNLIVLCTSEKDLTHSFSKEESTYIKSQFSLKTDLVHINRLHQHVFVLKVSDHKDQNIVKEKARISAFGVAKQLNSLKAKETSITGSVSSELLLAFGEGLALSNYQFLKYFSDKEERINSLKVIGIHGASAKEVSSISMVVDATCIARDLVNEPLSYLTAEQYSEDIKKLGKAKGFKVEVFNKSKIESLKMGGLLAVNLGSPNPPTFNIMEWKPANAVNKKPYVLVGKGVVYDTGGVSLKPTANSMDYMKCDMGGSATVVGAMSVISDAKLPIHIIGLVPATENRPGGNAYVPGDVITMHNGMTVEVLNTDAEGRMILADALSYARKYKPELVIDLATLTGAALRAIGDQGMISMGTADQSVQDELIESGYSTYERVVQFPFWDEYGEQIKSKIADIKNLGGPEAGMITAGKFLEHFTLDEKKNPAYPYIHLDIAGVAYHHSEKNYRGVEGSGVGVRLLFDFFSKKAKKK
ncbi:MAG: leucyl aminopeptidase [Flavobacteriales bacterium]|nr:leucyl aminopeptidase [Flavobacteriales bacterium]